MNFDASILVYLFWTSSERCSYSRVSIGQWTIHLLIQFLDFSWLWPTLAVLKFINWTNHADITDHYRVILRILSCLEIKNFERIFFWWTTHLTISGSVRFILDLRDQGTSFSMDKCVPKSLLKIRWKATKTDVGEAKTENQETWPFGLKKT